MYLLYDAKQQLEQTNKQNHYKQMTIKWFKIRKQNISKGKKYYSYTFTSNTRFS